MELLIWAGGRWRRVCPFSGRVAGWRRRARIVSNRRGVLQELPPLAALASIVKGPALPRLKKPQAKPLPRSPYKSFQSAIAVQTIIVQKDACIQTDTESVQSLCRTIHSNKTRTIPSKTTTSQDEVNGRKINTRTGERDFRSVSTEILELRTNNEEKNKKIEVHKNSNKENVKERTDTEKSLNIAIQKTKRKTESTTSSEVHKNRNKENVKEDIGTEKSKNIAKTKQDTGSTASSEDYFKELIIDEQDVVILRRYIETHETSIDLYRFDIDDYYKMIVFYKINPLVRIERCARISEMIKERHEDYTVHFARQLGLRSVNDSGEDKENARKRKKHRAAKEFAMSAINDEMNAGKARKKKKAKKDVVDEGSSSDIEEIRRNKTKNEQRRKTLEMDSDEESSVILRSKTTKKLTQETVDINSKGKQTKYIKHTAEGNKKEQSVHKKAKTLKTDENSDRGPKIVMKRNRTRSNVSDSDEVEQINNKIKSTKQMQPISSESNDEDTLVMFKLRKRKATNMTQDNVKKQDARKKPAVEKDSSKDSEKSGNEENLQPKNKKLDLGRRKIIIPKRSSVPPGREYSTLEDQAIVAWVSASSLRERAVKGNRIWKELQGGFFKLTGKSRSWQSLRNRYLRYILPSLGALALPPAHAQRLRAHAAIGELKAHKKTRRNSAFKFPAVRGASARAPRPALRSPTPKEIVKSSSSDSSESEKSDSNSPKRRRLRSSTHTDKQSPNKSDNRTQSPTRNTNRTQSPNKSTRSRIQTNRRQSPNKATNRTQSPSVRTQSSNKQTNCTQSSNKRTNRTQSPSVRTQSSNKQSNRMQSSNKRTNRTQSPIKSLQLRSPRSSPTYAELTRRFALRNRSTPHPSPTPSALHHKRRLYNPQRPASTDSSPAT